MNSQKPSGAFGTNSKSEDVSSSNNNNIVTPLSIEKQWNLLLKNFTTEYSKINHNMIAIQESVDNLRTFSFKRDAVTPTTEISRYWGQLLENVMIELRNNNPVTYLQSTDRLREFSLSQQKELLLPSTITNTTAIP